MTEVLRMAGRAPSSACAAPRGPRGTVHVLGQQLGRVEIRSLRESIGHVDPRRPVRSALTPRQVVLTGATGATEFMPRWRAPSGPAPSAAWTPERAAPPSPFRAAGRDRR